MGTGNVKAAFTGDSVSVRENGEVLEMGGGDGCRAMCVSLMPQNCMPKNGQNGQFYVMCIRPDKK